jgi:hypothetical protein
MESRALGGSVIGKYLSPRLYVSYGGRCSAPAR